MKRVAVAIMFLGILLVAGNAGAYPIFDWGLYPQDETPYMTDGSSSSKVESFNWEQTPNTYVKFLLSDMNQNQPIVFGWSFTYNGQQGPALPSTHFNFFNGAVQFDSNYYSAGSDLPPYPQTPYVEYWNGSLDANWSSWWGANKRTGDWTARMLWFNPMLGQTADGGIGYRQVNFSVTPEPISSALFLLGGGAMALFTFRRKKI